MKQLLRRGGGGPAVAGHTGALLSLPVLVVLLCTLILVAVGSAEAQVVDPVRPITAVPKADCGPGSDPEPLLQGQVPLSDRLSGRSLEGYSCNLKLVGQARQGEGASWQMSWYGDCAYYGTLANEARKTKEGSVVIDASNPKKPVVSDVLDTPAMLDPHESLKVNEKRGLLAAVELSGGTDTGPPGEDYFDIYDVKKDCAHPKLLRSLPIAGTTGHEGEWAPDGLTYYGSGGGEVNAIDVTNPRRPKPVGALGYGSHGLGISDDGKRAYINGAAGGDSCKGPGSMTILDVSEFQARKPDPESHFISDICWTDGAIPQHDIPFTSKGKPYILAVDEGGRGAARIIDISDETAPFIASRLKLEVHLDQYAAFFNIDGGPAPIFIYDGHYCAIDKRHDPTVAGCGYFESGIRVFDIRDPVNPKEIAYFNPPALPDEDLPASSASGGLWSGTADHCSGQIRFIPQKKQLWGTCQDNEFMILKFTNGAWPFKKGH